MTVTKSRRLAALPALGMVCVLVTWVVYTSTLLYQESRNGIRVATPTISATSPTRETFTGTTSLRSLEHYKGDSTVSLNTVSHQNDRKFIHLEPDRHRGERDEEPEQRIPEKEPLPYIESEDSKPEEKRVDPSETIRNSNPLKATTFASPTSRSDDEDLVKIPFGSLEMCSKDSGLFFICENDASCLAPSCESKNRSFTFHDLRNSERFWRKSKQRRKLLISILARMETTLGPNNEKQLIVMMFNSGFAHLFGNWYCGLIANKVEPLDDIRRHTLIIATDAEAIAFVKSLGFFTPTLEEAYSLMEWSSREKLDTTPATGFGLQAHAPLNLILKFAMPLDLIDLGYQAIIQDVDIVWVQNVLQELSQNTKEYCDDSCDAVFIPEARDYIARHELQRTESWRRKVSNASAKSYREANTGLFMVKPTSKMRSFLRTLLEANRLQQWKSRDQIVWNGMLHHRAFQEKLNFSFSLLPHTRFVPGKYLREKHFQHTNTTLPTKPQLIALHASDTTNFMDKYRRLKFVQHWYFDESTCRAPVEQCKALENCWNPFNATIQHFQTIRIAAQAKHVS